MSSTKKFPLDELVLDERCQARADVNHDAVQEYRAAYEAGVELPPPGVFMVSGKAVVVDGFHRVPAAIAAGKRWLRCEVVGEGTIDEAIWHAAAVNQTHGVRRTNADKRRAVRLALETEIGMEQSSRVIAEHVGVGDQLVNTVRAEVERQLRDSRTSDAGAVSEPSKRVGKDGKSYPAKKRQLRESRTSDPAVEAEPTSSEVEKEEPPATAMPGYGRDLTLIAKMLADVRRAIPKDRVPNHLVQSLEEAIKRAEGVAKFAVPETCPACGGPGCDRCFGHGWTTRAEAEGIRAGAKRLRKDLAG